MSEELERKIEELEDEISNLEREIKFLEEQNDKLQEDIEYLEEEKYQLGSEIRELEDKLYEKENREELFYDEFIAEVVGLSLHQKRQDEALELLVQKFPGLWRLKAYVEAKTSG